MPNSQETSQATEVSPALKEKGWACQLPWDPRQCDCWDRERAQGETEAMRIGLRVSRPSMVTVRASACDHCGSLKEAVDTTRNAKRHGQAHRATSTVSQWTYSHFKKKDTVWEEDTSDEAWLRRLSHTE